MVLLGWLGWWWVGPKVGGRIVGRLAVGLIVALLVVLSFFPVTGLDRSGGQFDDIATNFDASPHSIYRRDAKATLR